MQRFVLLNVVVVVVLVVVYIVDTLSRWLLHFMKIQLVSLSSTKQSESKTKTQNKYKSEVPLLSLSRNSSLSHFIRLSVSVESEYLVKIVAFHCLPFQLCATRRMNNVVMKWAHTE